MKFRAFMVCVLSFLVVTGSACFLNREQEKEEKLKAVYAAESTKAWFTVKAMGITSLPSRGTTLPAFISG